MKRKWNITKLIAIGAIAVIRLITILLIYNTLLLVSGSIYASTVMMIIGPFFNILAALVINKFGSSTIFSGIGSILELPTPTVWPKLFATIFNLINGLVVDIVWKYSKKKQIIFCFISGFLYNCFVILESIFIFFFIGLKGANVVPNMFKTPLAMLLITIVFSIIGGIVGIGTYYIYNKIKYTSIVKRISK